MSADRQEYQYFSVWARPLAPGRKTRDHLIIARGGDHLGVIKWYGPWRQFCFFPAPDSVWNKGCLDDVADYLRRLKDKRSQA